MWFRFRLSFIVVIILGIKNSFGQELIVQKHDGFGYELIQSKLEWLESRFSERFDQLEKQMERVEVAQQQFQDDVARNFTQLLKGIEVCHGNRVSQKSDQILNPQTGGSNHDPLLDPACKDLAKSTSGLCSMEIGGKKTTIYQVHRFDVDWLTVLQRSDGSENFDRNWTDYRDGFGTAGQEYWLGLEKLHILTKNANVGLLFELEDFTGNNKYARYDKFSIGSEEDLYRLDVLGSYSGTAKDSLNFHKARQFSTLDKGPLSSCAKRYTGGWWYFGCYTIHLTGKWQRANAWESIIWSGFGAVDDIPLKFVRMLIRKI